MCRFAGMVFQNHQPKRFLSGWRSFLHSEFFFCIGLDTVLASSSAPALLLTVPRILRVGIPLSVSTEGCGLEAVLQAHVPYRR